MEHVNRGWGSGTAYTRPFLAMEGDRLALDEVERYSATR